jgi:hypothetical protein
MKFLAKTTSSAAGKVKVVSDAATMFAPVFVKGEYSATCTSSLYAGKNSYSIFNMTHGVTGLSNSIMLPLLWNVKRCRDTRDGPPRAGPLICAIYVAKWFSMSAATERILQVHFTLVDIYHIEVKDISI